MPYRTALAIVIALVAASFAEARIRSLPAREPLPQAMLISPAAVEGPQAPIQLTVRAGCSCQGQAEACSCSGSVSERCCCAAPGVALAPEPAPQPKKLKRRASRR